ncbi:helix-turn-helix transcriptional regulator [Leifsonia kafniensis]|uniref:response regulator transcription factor n=1 Tax=Leifsonia kafniensis TaxID=475957 RepID=UPI0031E6080D
MSSATLVSLSDTAMGTLTPRELTVLTLVAAGSTNAAIAGHLSCSPRTVAKHLEHVYSKLHVSNRAAAAARLATELAENRRAAR